MNAVRRPVAAASRKARACAKCTVKFPSRGATCSAHAAAGQAAARVVRCCGTTPEHLRSMREALETRDARDRPTLDEIADALGGFSSTVDGTEADAPGPARRGNRRRRA